MRRHFPYAKLRNTSELMDCELDLTANPYKGFIELAFRLKHKQDLIFFPYLVTTEGMSLPLVGYNVIELCIKTGMTSPELASLFQSLSDIIDTSDYSDFLQFQQTRSNI